MKTVNLEFTNIPTNIPSIDYFLDKINNGDTFQFMRMNHGFVDTFRLTYKNWHKLKPHLQEKRYDEIAGYIGNVYRAGGKDLGLGSWHNHSEKQTEYIKNLVEFVFEYDNLPNKIHIGISLGVGLGTHWGVWQEHTDVQQHRSKFANILNDLVNKRFYYAGIVKHYTIENEWGRMFKLLNDKKFNVVFLGPETFGEFDKYWYIKNFHHIQIPRIGAIHKIDEYINTIKSIDKNSENPTMVFSQVGHILSAKIVKEIMDTNIYYWDIGRAFDIKMKEKFQNGDTAFKCWTQLDMNGLKDYVKRIRN
jgi:hypothetical protein